MLGRTAPMLPRPLTDNPAVSASASGRDADLVILGGTVEPIAPRALAADAVAVRGGRIVGVGTSAEVREAIGPGTETIELDDRAPAFEDGMAMIEVERYEAAKTVWETELKRQPAVFP